MGWHPSRIFRRCSTKDLETLVTSAGFQVNMFKLSLSKLQSSILPFSDRLPPIVTVCSGYSSWIATLIPSTAVGSWGGGLLGASATILHSAGIMVLLRIVNIPSSTGNLSILALLSASRLLKTPLAIFGWERDFSAYREALGGLLPCYLLLGLDHEDRCSLVGSFSLLGDPCLLSSPTSLFYLFNQFSAGPVIGGDALNFTVSITLLVLALKINPFVEVGLAAGFMIFLIKSGLVLPCMNLDILMHSGAPLTFINGFRWELVKPDPSGANERGIEHVAPVSALIMVIFQEVQHFSPSRRPTTCAVSDIPFFFNFSLAFTRAHNVVLDEIPGVLPSSV
ncbi:hypothetical protein Tco_0930818 [Tanacetum coccineum]